MSQTNAFSRVYQEKKPWLAELVIIDLHRSQDIITRLTEAWRMLQPLGVLIVRFPDQATVWDDPEARRGLTVQTFEAFVKGEYYSPPYPQFRAMTSAKRGHEIEVRLTR